MCKRLSLWVSGGARDDIFWRTAMSGGRATVQRKLGKINVVQSGDVCAVDPLGHPFVATNYVEIKHYRDLGIARGLVCGTGPLWSFWERTVREAASYGKHPLLIARQNLYPTLAVASFDASIFDREPMMTIHLRGIAVWLFDEATVVSRKMSRKVTR